ncbi:MULTISPECIES: PCMD domain-containing protein [Myroides]|uniref:Putative carbohydrate metabolism domain-containing protein n=1 Tax=Myroides albus TaxID=2562892 RepID=A0A6I3LFP5_9FLAO|nr:MULTISPECIES: PCMD domain-containing protein [Myroides]MTG96614.1 hypothetical protein [Myroides albus]MVX34610.1 hypothetical protein [Myroides sp. LoEW2-1]UVD80973.1 PCMD domain-containing protein [Myroides albus]
MKKNYLLFSLFLLISVTLSSCIKDEAPSKQAYILEATIADAEVLLLNHNKKVGDEDIIIFQLKQNKEDNIFAPEFVLSPGATIQPESGTSLDFTNGPQKYIVTSEDHAWTKTYYVNFILSEFPTYFNLEDYLLYKGSAVLQEEYDVDERYASDVYINFISYTDKNEVNTLWSSGNQGFSIMPAGKLKLTNPSQYPTAVDFDGYKGKAAKLSTILTGLDHKMTGFIKTPGIAAGNLFTGTFSLNMSVPAASPKFGIPYNTNRKPITLKGFYKYKAGDFYGAKNEFALKDLDRDTWDAYAILFEKTTDKNYLDGVHNFESEKMVMVARIEEGSYPETEQWTPFEANFKNVNDKTFDPSKEYMIALVFTSSIQGADFRGAIGSTLWIDEIELVLEDN